MLAEDSTERGLARKYDYCAKCAEIVDERTGAMSDLQERIAALWVEGLEKVNAEAKKKCPQMKFPL